MRPQPVLPRPTDGEYAEYFHRYVSLVPRGNILEILTVQMEETQALLAGIAPEMETHRYAPEKWSVREVVGHVMDAEWVFAYRALSIARQEETALPSMDQDAWASTSNAHARPMEQLAREWADLRRTVVNLFGSLDADDAARRGLAGGNFFTVRSFAWIIAGHEIYHRARLKEDYLGQEA